MARVGPGSAIDPKEQVSFYDPGLGTDIGTTAITSPLRFVQKQLASVTGRGITTNIAECYEFIINHYVPGDRIYLIGFSRGAYTVRALANLLRLCGVPSKSKNGDLRRFRKEVRDIAEEGVDTVLEHGAGHPREKYEDEREELARRFRGSYGSGDRTVSNVAPYFIGVFDTVAALGAMGLRRQGIFAALFLAIFFGSLFVTTVASVLFGTTVWRPAIALSILAGLVLWVRQRGLYRKAIRDFPNPGDYRSRFAEWKGEFFDRLLARPGIVWTPLMARLLAPARSARNAKPTWLCAVWRAMTLRSCKRRGETSKARALAASR
jgi:hypothetical protein